MNKGSIIVAVALLITTKRVCISHNGKSLYPYEKVLELRYWSSDNEGAIHACNKSSRD